MSAPSVNIKSSGDHEQASIDSDELQLVKIAVHDAAVVKTPCGA
jgi:hypothetical protein